MAANNQEKPIIMVLEKTPEQLGVIEGLVSSEVTGCVFIRAYEVKKATETVAKAPPKMLISEAHLPDGDVIELLNAFPRAQREFSILIVTNDKSEELQRQLFDAGADDVLLKPIDDLIFLSKVRSMISQQYISPMSFLGRREGLGDFQFTAPIRILKLNEEVVTLLSPFPMMKPTVFTFFVRDFKLRATVESSARHEKISNQFQIQAHLDSLNEGTASELRRLLLELSTGQSAKLPERNAQ